MRKEFRALYINSIKNSYPIYQKKKVVKRLIEEQLVVNRKKRNDQLVLNYFK